MLKNPLERSTHPSAKQIEALLQYLEQYPELARGFPKFPAGKLRARRHWEQLAPRLNSIGKSVKTWQQWVKYWADKKSSVKKKAALRDAAVNGAGDPDMVMELSDVEQQILALTTRDPLHPTCRPVSSYENSCSEIDVPNASGAEDHLMMDSSEVVLLVSPATLMQEASPPQLPPTTPSRSPSPSPPQELYHRSTPHADPPPLRYRGAKQRRRGHSQPPPEPSIRRSHLASLTERFLNIEEQRLEVERRNANILETMAGVASQLMERDFERERVFAQALQTVGDGLRLLAEALRKDEPVQM